MGGDQPVVGAMRDDAPIVHHGVYDPEFYEERTRRIVDGLGGEPAARQALVQDATIGIAGTGPLGGAAAESLGRAGVLHLKLADFGRLDPADIDGQPGAGIDSMGRNKAVTLGARINEIAPDVEVEVFAEGITPDSVRTFVQGCDYMIDHIDPSARGSREILHRAFRESARCRCIVSSRVLGSRTYIWKYTRDSVPLDQCVDPVDLHQQAPGDLAPDRAPLTDQPVGGDLLVARLVQLITSAEGDAGARALPAAPGYAMFDSSAWTATLVDA